MYSGIASYPFESKEAEQLNIDIFETIYYAALCASRDLAKVDGPYESYAGSPISQGIFQVEGLLFPSRCALFHFVHPY